MALEEGKVVGTAQQLNELGYVSIDYGERVVKYSHRAPGMLQVTREEQAVLAMLMLREPLTVNDLKARTDKMIGFESSDRVQETLDQLLARRPAIVMQLPISVGQREQRYTHLLAGEPDISALELKPASSAPVRGQAAKMAELEARIKRLEDALDMRWDDDTNADNNDER